MDRDQARITDCGHPGCISCLSAWLAKSSTCPICRHSITLGSLLDLPPDETEYVEPDQDVKPIRSAKIDEVIRYLKLFDATDKTLVFSQFTSFLDHVGAALAKEGIRFCRFDGSMPAKKVSSQLTRHVPDCKLTLQRQEVITAFQRPIAIDTNGSPTVMLISLKSGAVGLNLTAASNVFLASHICNVVHADRGQLTL